MAKLTQEEKDAINDAAKAQWWENWYAWDYSWDGLADKPWQGWMVVEDKVVYDAYLKDHGLPDGVPDIVCRVVPVDQLRVLPAGANRRKANLQDYWRDQESILVKCEGQKTYTNIHLPLKYRDGTRTWKDDPNHKNWRSLTDLLTKRLASGVKTKKEIRQNGILTVEGQEGRAQFCGGVLPAFSSSLERSNIQLKWLIREARRTSQEDRSILHLTLFQAVTIQSVDFSDAIFGSDFNANNAQFIGDYASFYGAQFNGGNASFRGAKFTGGHASFVGAKFKGGRASFDKAQFIGGPAYFNEAKFMRGSTSFKGVNFTGGSAFFDESKFTHGNASFEMAKFTGGHASFRKAQFTGWTSSSDETHFTGGSASFHGAQFTGGDAIFTETWFKRSCNFRNALIEKQAMFIDTVFPPAKGSESAFRGTEFLGTVDFSRTKIQYAKDEKGQTLQPEQRLFPFNAFESANIKDQLILSGIGDEEAQQEFSLALKSVEKACHEYLLNANIKDKNTKRKREKLLREERYFILEQGCKTIKNMMEKTSDKNRAQRYFKFELLARQKRPSTSPIARYMTDVYGLVADYGGSIGRPIGSLFWLWFFCALFYGFNAQSLGVSLDNPKSMIWEPAGFSAKQVFRPLFIWSTTVVENKSSWLSYYKKELSEGGWFAIQLLATIQSLLSITLLFLFGLATKRKFQIS